jgi:hypothetical protein
MVHYKSKHCTHFHPAVPLLINALKHVSTSRSQSGNVSLYHGAHRCRVASCVAAHTVLRDGRGQQMADAGCAGAASGADDSCMHSAVLDAAGERAIDDSLLCLVPGTSIRFDGDGRGALASEWMAKGSKEQLELKAELAALIEEHAVPVTRAIPVAFCGDGFPFRAGDVCGECLVFGDVAGMQLNGETVHLVDGYPAVYATVKGVRILRNLANLAFLGHPMHGTGSGGFVAVHRCHNSAVRTVHSPFAPPAPRACAPTSLLDLSPLSPPPPPRPSSA